MATVLSLSVGESGDTAVEGTDYGTVGSQTLTISAGAISATATFTLNPTADDLDEDDETLTVDGSVTGLSVTATSVTIRDNDTAGVTVSPTTLSISRGQQLELHGGADFEAERRRDGDAEQNRQHGRDVQSVAADVHDGQLVDGADGDGADGAGRDALNDTATLAHAVSGADYGTVTAASVTVTVRDDETVSTVVVLTVNPTRLSEGAGETEITITASLNQAPRNVATVLSLSVGESGDTALEGTDYATVGGLTLTIGAGATSATATFDAEPDGRRSGRGRRESDGGRQRQWSHGDIDQCDDQRQRHGRSDGQSDDVVGQRGRELELHGGADFEAERRRDGDAEQNRQRGRDVQSVAADVHDGQLVDGADGDGADGAGRGRAERHGDAGARGQRGGLRDGDGGVGDGHGEGRRDGLDGAWR